MKLKHYFRRVLLTLAAVAAASGLYAQSRQVTGKVLDFDGTTPLVGCTVVVDGTSNGVITDLNGAYSIKVDSDESVLVFSSLGYDDQKFTVGSRTVIDVTMQQSNTRIDDVVVTALGLSRQEKSLGYAVSKVDNEALTSSVASNWMSSMNGRVPGLTMGSAGSGPGGTVRVTLRGDNSLNYGKNEALYVVDGVPILSTSQTSGSGASYANGDTPVDFGNAVSDLNPEDIESVSVLKGGAASALYGARAANGAIIITTKSGRKDKGWGVSYNGSVSFEQAGWFPDFQKEYGASAVTTVLTNREFSAWGLPASMTKDGIPVIKQASRYAFGEKFDASKMRYLYQSKNWETGEFTRLPWVYADDWYTGIFKTGITYTNSVAVEGASGKGTSARFSFTDTRNDWIMPNSGFNRQTYALTLNQKLTKRIDLSAKMTFTRRQSDNMPTSGYDETSPMYGLLWGYNVYPMSVWRDEYMKGRYTRENFELGQNGSVDPYNVTSSLVYNSEGGHNPYRVLYEELNTLVRNRVYGNVSVTAHIVDGLDLMLRGGMDINNDFRTQRKPKMTADWVNGMYREQTLRDYEFNMDFLLKYNKSFFGDRFAISAAVGANELRRSHGRTVITAPELDLEGPSMYTLANSAVALETSAYRREYALHSVYAFLNLSWDDTYFLDITGRNDWSSTLHPSKWSYFYPSVSASVLLDRAFKINTWAVNMIKLRASWANVGSDTDPYSLYDNYSSVNALPGGFRIPASIKNAYIQNENTATWEVGLETKLLDNRLNFDIAYYNTDTTNQILSASTSAEIGATSMVINAGRVNNQGIELSFRVRPVVTKDIMWEIHGNWSKNKTVLKALTDDWDPTQPFRLDNSTTIGSRTYIYSYVGQEMLQIYGSDYVRAPEGATYIDANGQVVDCSGAIIIDSNTGYPSLTSPNQYIARVTPKWRAGFGTTFRYKNLSISALFTAQVGGNAFSVTNFGLSYQGKLKNSLPGRDDGLVVDGVNAVENGDGTTTYTKNNTITSNVLEYYNKFKWVRDNTRENTFSTDFLKFKELSIDYRLPETWMRKSKVFREIAVGVFATNLFCISPWPQYDPEAAGLIAGASIYPGIETGSFPMTRTFGFKVKLSF